MSAQLAIAQPRRIKATHRRRRKVAAGPIVQRYYDPAIGRFLSADPAASGFNLYNYANDNPYRFTDPDGRFAKGSGWTTPGAWQKFDRAQKKAAKETAAGAKQLRSAVAAGGKSFAAAQAKFEKSFGAGTGTAENMQTMASNLEAMSGALSTSDPATGFVANAISGAQTAATPGADKNVAIFVLPNQSSLNVNIDHSSLGSSSYFIPVGHDSAHAALKFHDEEVNGTKAIFSGDAANRAAFLALPLTDPARAMANPDTIMRSTQ